jgi:CDP-diacylglycerol--serine O-phosphatidyltransferase
MCFKINPHFCKVTNIKRLIPNLFTAGNLVGGILAIIFTLNGRIDMAPYFIFASAIFDFLDGFMARLLKVPSELGKQLDSLADMVTFGVAPGLMVYEMIRQGIFLKYYFQDFLPSLWTGFYPAAIDSMSGKLVDTESVCSSNEILSIDYLPYFAFIIPVFALFRLAKFNLDTRQSDAFIGLPTPAMTLFFAVMPILIKTGLDNFGSWQYEISMLILNPYFLISASILFSILMLVELPLFALKFKHFKWKGNEIRFIFLTISVVLLATLFLWAIPLIVILYVILSLIYTQIRKAKTDEI